MKPCSNNQKLIALWVVDALEANQADSLRAHLETCECCRRYRDEVTAVTKILATRRPGPEIQSTELFHRRVMNRLKQEPPAPLWARAMGRLRNVCDVSHLTRPMLGAAAVLLLSVTLWRLTTVPSTSVTTESAPGPMSSLDPTLFNYQMMANRSPDTLDQFLHQQGGRIPPSAPIQTASALGASGTLE